MDQATHNKVVSFIWGFVDEAFRKVLVRGLGFMLPNPPHGKSWKRNLEAMDGKDGLRDPRFKVMHQDEELSLLTRSSDGPVLFLGSMASKTSDKTRFGGRQVMGANANCAEKGAGREEAQ